MDELHDIEAARQEIENIEDSIRSSVEERLDRFRIHDVEVQTRDYALHIKVTAGFSRELLERIDEEFDGMSYDSVNTRKDKNVLNIVVTPDR